MELSDYGVILGRSLIAAYFVTAALVYARSWRQRVERLRARKILLPTLTLWLCILAYLAGGVILFFGWHATWVASLFILILALANGLYYRFWCFQDDERRQALLCFMNNVALIGALVLVIF